MTGVNRHDNDNTREGEKQAVFTPRGDNKGGSSKAVLANTRYQLCGKAVSYLQGVLDEVEQAV